MGGRRPSGSGREAGVVAGPGGGKEEVLPAPDEILLPPDEIFLPTQPAPEVLPGARQWSSLGRMVVAGVGGRRPSGREASVVAGPGGGEEEVLPPDEIFLPTQPAPAPEVGQGDVLPPSALSPALFAETTTAGRRACPCMLESVWRSLVSETSLTARASHACPGGNLTRGA